MRLLDGLIELLAPTRCVGCELPGALLCERCLQDLPRIDADVACPHCGAPYGAMVCTECWSTEFAFAAALSLGELEGALARAVVLHKDAGERRLGPLLGSMLAEAAATRWRAWPDAVCWVPATGAAIARRGFDHSAAIAAPVAQRFGVDAEPLLVRSRARDQRHLGREGRLASARGTFAVARPLDGARALVVDDVLTTGATLDAAAQALLAAGAAEVRAAVVARAW